MVYKKQRNSNIELLRVVAMLMIVLYHIVCHCVNIQVTEGGLFNQPIFFKHLLILSAIMPLGSVGNAIFMLISGYFMASKGTKIDLLKISKKLLMQLGFASMVLVISSTIVYRTLNGSMYAGLISVDSFNTMAWFVGYYFSVVLFGMLFLNSFLEKLDENKYLTYLFVLFALIQFGWTFGLINGLSSNLGVFCTGVFLYSLGGYLKKYNPLRKVKTSVFIALILICCFFVLLSSYNITSNNIENYTRSASTDLFFQTVPGFSNNSIIVIIIGVSLFEIFTRINIPQRRILNYLGQATFMVYLIHDNSFFYSIWNTQDWITLLYYQPNMFMVKILLYTIGTFIIGVVVFTIYNLLCKILDKYKWIYLRK